MSRRTVVSAAVASMLCCAAASVAWACPGCKDALFDVSGARQAVTTAHGYAITIALLLGVPLTLLGGVAALVVRAQRRSRRPEAP